jgi:hypothetical protein
MINKGEWFVECCEIKIFNHASLMKNFRNLLHVKLNNLLRLVIYNWKGIKVILKIP